MEAVPVGSAPADGRDQVPEAPDVPYGGGEHRGKPVWAVVANVIVQRPEGGDPRPGTKDFRGGAKVYIIVRFPDDGCGEAITVLGYHRQSHKVITRSVTPDDLTNWRVERTHHRLTNHEIRSWGELRQLYNPATGRWVGPDSSRAKQRAKAIVEQYKQRGATVQPFTTRPWPRRAANGEIDGSGI